MSRILIGIWNFYGHCRNTRPRRVPIGATCQMIAGFGIYLKRGPNRVHRIEAFLERLDPSPPRLEPVTPPKIVSSLTTKKLQFFFRYFPQFSTLMEIPHEKPWKIAEDRTLKAGSSPPRAEMPTLKLLFLNDLRSKTFGQIQNLVPHRLMSRLKSKITRGDTL